MGAFKDTYPAQARQALSDNGMNNTDTQQTELPDDPGPDSADVEGGGEYKRKSALRENLEAIVIAILLALFVRTFVVQAFKIPSGSMIPTLLIGDHILVNKFIYGVRMPFTNAVLVPVSEPERWDIVVFRYPEDPSIDFIKRVVATGGETVEIRDRVIYVDGRRVDDDHGVWRGFGRFDGENYGPATVPPDHVFVMGDNRNHSYDSRFWGFVSEDALRGKAFIVYYSRDKSFLDVRWDRIGHMLH